MHKVFFNTGSNLMVMMVKLVITLIMTPVFIHNLGNYDYGIWEIIGAILGYMGLLDIGLRPSITRFSAKYKAESKLVELNELYSTSFVFLLIIGTICLFVFFSWGALVPESIAPEGSEDIQRYSFLLFILGVRLLITFPGFVAESFLEGFQQYAIRNNVTIITSVVSAFIVFTLINPENALLLIAGVSTIGLGIKYLAYFVILSKAKFGRFVPLLNMASWDRFTETISFGVKSFVQGVASRIEIGSDTLVIGFFLGPAAVPFYAIPANLLNYIRNIGWTTTHAFMPFFSDLSTRGSKEDLRNAFMQYSKYVVAFMMPMCVGAALVGPEFIGLWIGTEYVEKAPTIVLILVLYISLPFLNPFSTRYLTAVNKHGYSAKVYTVAALSNLGLSIVLVQYWGIEGVALGSLIPMMVLVPVLMAYGFKDLGLTFGRYFSSVVFPVLPATIVMGGAVFFFKQNIGLHSYLMLGMGVVTGASVYVLVFLLTGVNKEERALLKNRFIG